MIFADGLLILLLGVLFLRYRSVQPLGTWLVRRNQVELGFLGMGIIIVLGLLNPWLGFLRTGLLGLGLLVGTGVISLRSLLGASAPTLPPIRLLYDAVARDRFRPFQQACTNLSLVPLILVKTKNPIPFEACWPKNVTTNVEVWKLTVQETKLYFFPDCIFLEREAERWVIGYDKVQVQFSSCWDAVTTPPQQAEILGYTWKYMKDGQPDPRYPNNPRLAMVLSGLLEIVVDTEIAFQLRVADPQRAEIFAQAFPTTERTTYTKQEQRQEQKQETRETPPSPRPIAPTSAYDVLGIAPGSSLAEITAAYRQMAQRYHPDKVAGLAPEFHELAERRMKEINIAYQTLKRS